MKFCKFCGKQLNDNEVCTCQQFKRPIENSEGESSINATIDSSPYATVSTTSNSQASEKFSKGLKNFPISFKAFWKNADSTIDIAKKENDFILSSIYSAILFLALLFFNMFLILAIDHTEIAGYSLSSFGGGFFNFGKVLLTAVVMTIVVEGVYILFNTLTSLLYKKGTTKDLFKNSFISISLNSLPASILFLLSGVSAFVSLKFAVILLVLAIVYLLVIMFNDTFKNSGSITTGFKSYVVVLLAIVLFALFAYISLSMLKWNFAVSDTILEFAKDLL